MPSKGETVTDNNGIQISCIQVRNATEEIKAIFMQAVMVSRGGDMMVLVGGDDTLYEMATAVLFRDHPWVRSHLLTVDSTEDMTKILHEYQARLERWSFFNMLFVVVDASVLNEWRELTFGKWVDGDHIVSWPAKKGSWITHDYAPFKNRMDMVHTHDRELQAYLKENPKDRILFNAGVDAINGNKDGIFTGLVTVSRGILTRNLEARKAGYSKKELKLPPQPINIDAAYQRQEEYRDIFVDLELPIWNGFEEMSKWNPKPGVIVAVEGAGKSTFITEANSNVKCKDLIHLFTEGYKQLIEVKKDNLRAATAIARSKFIVGSNFPALQGSDVSEHLERTKWMELLRITNSMTFGPQVQQRTFQELMRKAGTANAWICRDERLIPFSGVLKDIDPLAIQIGKKVNTLIAYQESYKEAFYPTDFAQMYFSLVTGASPWDNEKITFSGVVPHMVNVSSGVWNGLLWSTSPFGMLYMPQTFHQSVVPLFPQLMLTKQNWDVTGILTPLDINLGYFYKAQGNVMRQFEWVLVREEGPTLGHGYINVKERADVSGKTYKVTVSGEEIYKRDAELLLELDEPVLITNGTSIPIRNIKTLDGQRMAEVMVDFASLVSHKSVVVKGQVSLGSPVPLFPGSEPVIIENDEALTGKRVIVKALENINPDDIIFRCGELFDEGLFIYLAMINRALMGTGKIPSRMTYDQAIQKVRLRVQEGIDRSGHVSLAANLPPLQQNVFLASVALNECGAYDARGIYNWSGLPVGKWHTLDDYQSAVEFGMKERTAAPRVAALKSFMGFFQRLRMFTSHETEFDWSEVSLIEAAHMILSDVEWL